VSQRPRLAGDGTLTLPAKVAFDNQGFIRGRHSERTVDPFEWTADRLLLAESFARLDLGDRRAMKAWWVTHGALDLLDFWADEEKWSERRQPADAFADSREDAADEQANVRWHLATLVRLSDTREAMEWDPAWAELVLDFEAGGTTGLLPDVAPSSWESMLELERVVVEFYVAHAVERRFRIELEPRGEDGRKVLVPREDRQWNSILAPIYLQLFEALRRISGGEPGAATCRECGRPFLVLDARRRFFCNDRERFRFSQREHRRRLSAPPA